VFYLKKQSFHLAFRFTVFPEGCSYFRGPHSQLCFESIWYDSGCITEGYLHPDNFTIDDQLFFNQMDLM